VKLRALVASGGSDGRGSGVVVVVDTEGASVTGVEREIVRALEIER